MIGDVDGGVGGADNAVLGSVPAAVDVSLSAGNHLAVCAAAAAAAVVAAAVVVDVGT